MIHPPANLVEEVTTRVRDSVRAEVRGNCYRVAFRAMSTPVNLVFVAPSPAIGNAFQRKAVDWIAQFEARYSRFLPGSIIGQINASAGGDWIDVDEEAHQMFSLCDEMHRLTQGIFNPNALPLLRAGIGRHSPCASRARSKFLRRGKSAAGRKSSEENARSACQSPAWESTWAASEKNSPSIRFAYSRENSASSDVMIDIGQDIRVTGHPPGKDAWYIGLEEPDQPGQCWTAVRLSDHAVATSGDYFRSFTLDGRRYGHILDPRTGLPVSNSCQSVSVIAPTCVLAGILSTAAFILGGEEGLNLIRTQPNVEACITTDNARHQTRKFSSYVPA